MKLSTLSGNASVLLTQVPGRGSGTFALKTGNHAELDVACAKYTVSLQVIRANQSF